MSITLSYSISDTGIKLYNRDTQVGFIGFDPEERMYVVTIYPVAATGDSPSDDGSQFNSLEAAKYYALAMYIELTQVHVLKTGQPGLV
jgi:hypothetical protein